jgi:hypothetical protein
VRENREREQRRRDPGEEKGPRRGTPEERHPGVRMGAREREFEKCKRSGILRVGAVAK